MNAINSPLRTGIALALTVGVGYAACALVFWLFPEAAAGFMTSLFHGLDFHKLQSGAALFSFGGFVYALAVIMVWAFCLGTFFGWLLMLLGGGRLASQASAVAVDPVCGMSVNPAKAAGSYSYRGKTYFFCSTHCLGTFRSDPAKHVDAASGHTAVQA
jgi:YHS domain-containing protein